MKITKLFHAAIATGFAVLIPQLAGAADVSVANSEEPKSVTVHYGGLDLANGKGAEALYSRLRGAARQVCATLDGRELRQKAAYRSCYNEALGNAVNQVNREAVTVLHNRAVRAERAS